MVWRASQRAEGGERGHRKDFNYNRHNHHNEEGNNNRRYNRNPTGGEEGYQPNSWKYTRGKSDESGNSSGYQPNRAWSSRGRSYSSGGDDANDSSNQPKERSGWQRGIGVNGESNAGHSANGGFRPSNKNATSGPSGTGSAKVSGTPAAVAPPVPSANKIPPPGNAWTRAKPSL